MITYEKVVARIKTWCDPETFFPGLLRGILMGAILNITLAEICAYKLIVQHVKAGELPSYFPEMLIILLSVLEAVSAPLVSWWGYRCRRLTLIVWSSLVTFCIVMWLFLPSANERPESELCGEANRKNNLDFVGMTPKSVARLVIVLFSCVVFVLARVGTWSHGVAYLEEYDPDGISVHYGVILLARVVPSLVGMKILTNIIDWSIPLQTLLILLGLIVNHIQLFLIIPKRAPLVKGILMSPPSMQNRDLFSSLGRILRNPIAMVQILAMTFLASSLWGFAFYQNDILKAKFNFELERNAPVNFVELSKYVALVFIVLFVIVRFAAPILTKYCKKTSVAVATVMSVLTVAMYVLIMTVPSCDKGNVAGLTSSYTVPECSSRCGCKPRWDEFSPVCLLDDMTTYLSPCQAGCSELEVVNGIQLFTNCSCGAFGRATPGACSDADCRTAADLHHTFFLMLVTFMLLAFQSQGVTLLKVADARDKSVVFGVAWAAVALIVYVFGQLTFGLFRGSNIGLCGWIDGGKCHLHNELFANIITLSSITLALISTVLSIATLMYIRIQETQNLLQERSRL